MMRKGIIRQGDKLTRGGEVITATSTFKVNGKMAARIGDLVSCPLPGHGINRIVGSTPQYCSDGGFLAFDHYLCECGCQVLSSAPDTSFGG